MAPSGPHSCTRPRRGRPQRQSVNIFITSNLPAATATVPGSARSGPLVHFLQVTEDRQAGTHCVVRSQVTNLSSASLVFLKNVRPLLTFIKRNSILSKEGRRMMCTATSHFAAVRGQGGGRAPVGGRESHAERCRKLNSKGAFSHSLFYI